MTACVSVTGKLGCCTQASIRCHHAASLSAALMRSPLSRLLHAWRLSPASSSINTLSRVGDDRGWGYVWCVGVGACVMCGGGGMCDMCVGAGICVIYRVGVGYVWCVGVGYVWWTDRPSDSLQAWHALTHQSDARKVNKLFWILTE